MADRRENRGWKERLTAWVDGEREPRDQTLFVMEQRPQRSFLPTEEEHERREKHRLNKFFALYPVGAAVICLALVAVLMAAVLEMPAFGNEDNPTNNEVSQHYLEHGEEETGAENMVTAMIISYRGFDTLGESCVLFLAVTAVMMLLLRDEKNTGEEDLVRLRREDETLDANRDAILKQAAWVLTPFVFLFAIYVLLHGEESPGGGFSGGTILGAGLILFSSAFGHVQVRTIMDRKAYAAVRTAGLLTYALLYGVYIFTGANGMPNYLRGMALLIDFAVGLVVACTVYGFFALFSRGEL